MDIPKHREIKVDGGRYMPPIKRLLRKVAELEKALEKANLDVAAAEAYINPSSILGLLVDKMKDSLVGARLGELAQASKAILEVEKAQELRESSVPMQQPEWIDEFMNNLKKNSKERPKISVFDKGETPSSEVDSNYE